MVPDGFKAKRKKSGTICFCLQLFQQKEWLCDYEEKSNKIVDKMQMALKPK